MNKVQGRNRALIKRLLAVAVLMFGFGFALVPLYDVFCRVTGLNGKVTQASAPADTRLLAERRVTVRFITNNNENMPWSFSSAEKKVVLNPGQTYQTHFRVHNPTQQTMIAQAVPSISPGQGAQYLHKINCFCFDQQSLQAGASMDMPLVISIDPAIPEHIHALTLSYTLFDITPGEQGALSGNSGGRLMPAQEEAS
ncbi:cytochrome c oxidase assembly protein [Granulosicoccaceae sp. 1_MG-2023]|nr:cytochrome c oxidase assembly protein [Granulosicoccaceae sp. 1_MG-2023]